ncbi:hypothetical protein PHJA_002083300 [Phtheirospermum japonicum]|uniref:Uncharacterized protein n=1 Tax=Phtheirospermum japonicum TaxID=374723 RepID=A0A830CMC1_9LAMI|nr:hypothetical protein PHJA_002083300 [Phtheirospermum japonicum]
MHLALDGTFFDLLVIKPFLSLILRHRRRRHSPGHRRRRLHFGRQERVEQALVLSGALTCIFQYSLGAITQTFSGHVETLDLAAFSIQNSIIGGLSLGIMVWCRS